MKSTMKKSIISSAFAVLLMLFAAPSASAEEYCELGTVTAGGEINCYIAQIDEGATAGCDALPTGCSLYLEQGMGCQHLSLRGVPVYAGTPNFTIELNGGTDRIVCSMEILPSTPIVQVCGDIGCYRGEHASLSVNARSSDGGALSYQWYSGEGFAAIPIAGATGSSYSPDTSQLGSFAYCCEVYNVNNGRQISVMSQPMRIYVSDPVISGITVESMPKKTRYDVGDMLDLNGFTVRVNYDNGSSEVISDCFGVDPMKLSAAGTQTVRVTYQGFSTSFNVSVQDKKAVRGIGVVTLPKKTEYKVGENLETAGLSIRAYTDDGQFDVSSGLDCSPTVMRTAGKQTITVKYEDKTCTFTVTVEEEKKVTGIAVASLPVKRTYNVGDTLDLTGLSLELKTVNGSEPLTEGYTCSPMQLTSAGTQEINVVYGRYSCAFKVIVKEKNAPSPSPSATVKPTVTPQPSANVTSPSVSPTHTSGAKQTNSGNTNALVKVIFVIALVALAGLTGYIFYMQKRGNR